MSIPLFHPAPSLFANNQYQKCSHFHMQCPHRPSSWAFLCIHILVPQKVYDPTISHPSLSLECGKPAKLGYYSLNVCKPKNIEESTAKLCTTQNGYGYKTSSRYLIPFWDVWLTQSGPQPQLGPHSKTTPIGATNLEEKVNQSIR